MGKKLVVLGLLFAMAMIPSAVAQEKAASGSTGTKIEIGLEERLRSEAWDNLMDFSDAKYDSTTQYRLRTRVWSKFNFGSNVELNLGLNNESKYLTRPTNKTFSWDETIVETAYLDYKFSPNWQIRAGRQNIMKGEGFVIFDGTSGDGSRTAYFNAINLAYSWNKSKLEFMVIADPHKDIYLPRTKTKNKALQEWNEEAFAVYYTNKEMPKTGIEAYYIYKLEKDDYKPYPLFDKKFSTLGGRAVHDFGSGWSGTAEFAYQFGKDKSLYGWGDGPDRDVNAWGGYVYAKKAFDVAWKPSIQVGYWAMSGDDPKTEDKNEGWDPVFSRWPKWSELYIYTLARESGYVAYWTNNNFWQFEVQAKPVKNLNLRATYYIMKAFENPMLDKAPSIIGSGKDRGNNLQLRVDYTLNQNWKGHALYETFDPGDYYRGEDKAYFLRFEVSYAFKKLF